MTAFWLALAAKMATSAAVVVAASLMVERSGPMIGALIATLPISAGPAYVFLALDHPPDFLAQSSLVSLTVSAATAQFIFVYAALARSRGLLMSLSAALVTWLCLAVLLAHLKPGFAGAAALNALSYGSAYLLTRRLRTASRPARSGSRWWDLPSRAATVMTVVAAVVLSGRWLGPEAAGLAATLPVVVTSLVLVLHPRLGGPATAAVLATSVPGMVGFTTGLATLHLTVQPLGAPAALLVTLAVCVFWNVALLALNIGLERRARPKQAADIPAEQPSKA